MLNINDALKAIGLGLLVLFFAVGVVKTCSSVADLKRPEHALKLFVRFALAKAAVTYGLDLMLAVFRIVQGMVSTIITRSGLSGSTGTTLPQEIIDKINDVGFWDSIRDYRQDQRCGVLGLHPPVGGDPLRRPVHHRFVVHHDSDGV